MSTLKIGDKAPAFSVIGTDLKPITSEDYKDKKLVLLFFPLAFSGGCTEEMCALRDDYSVYEKFNASILGVSVDSPFVMRKFGSENELNFPLGSDFNRTVSKSYDSLFEGDFAGMTGFSMRTAFVIDQEGVIQYIEKIDGNHPNVQAIQEVLEKL